MRKNSLHLVLIILMIFPLLISQLIACNNNYNTVSGTTFFFDTTIDIKISSYTISQSDLENNYNEIVNILSEYSKLTDNFKEYPNINNVYSINHSNDYLEVSDKLISILKLSIVCKEKTSGFFNPLIGEISNIYKDIIDSEELPTDFDNLINEKVNDLNNSYIDIIDNKVKIIGEGKIDLGGIAKGYVLDIIKDYLEEENITDYLINAGTSSILLGTKNKNKGYYKIASKYDDLRIFNIKNNVLGTSSIFEQNVIIDNVLYHHIINPYTGRPVNNYDVIYLIGNNGALIDAYTTALFSMDLEDIKSFVSNNNLTVIIYKDNKVIYNNSQGDYYG